MVPLLPLWYSYLLYVLYTYSIEYTLILTLWSSYLLYGLVLALWYSCLLYGNVTTSMVQLFTLCYRYYFYCTIVHAMAPLHILWYGF